MWFINTPLGLPVVPEVKMISDMSVPFTSPPSRADGDPLVRKSDFRSITGTPAGAV